MIGIIKYKAGNLASVANALERLGAAYFISDSAEELEKANGIIFPGVGHARAAMEDLKAKKLDRWLKNTRKPVLGICLGMQLFYESSEEGETALLGILPGRLKKFDSGKGKVPHIGWNRTRACVDPIEPSVSDPIEENKDRPDRVRTNAAISAWTVSKRGRFDKPGDPAQNNPSNPAEPHPLFKGFSTDPAFYYVHSYYASPDQFTIATCSYIRDFTASCSKDNFMGVQFHPEKSGEAGSLLLRNFLELAEGSAEWKNSLTDGKRVSDTF